MRIYKLCFLLPALVLIVASAAVAQFGLSEPVVSSRILLSVDKLRPGDSFELAVEATVKEGYHVGAHGKDADSTQLTLTASKGIVLQKPVYPKAQLKPYGIAPDENVPVYEGTFVITAKGRVAKDADLGTVAISSTLETQACAGDQCFPPEQTKSSVETSVVGPGETVKQINKKLFATTVESSASAEGEENRVRSKLASMNALLRILLLYGLGLVLAFTPCVYPMIPVTIGYFGSQEDKRTKKVALLAGVYVLGLAVTYAVLGAVASMPGRQFGEAMQSPYVLMGIAGVLVVLAASMFGLYELRPPAFIMNKSSGKSGVLGALVMGAIFGVVAAPCVGPVVLGLLLYVAQIGNPVMGFLLFFVLAVGMGTPLFFLAAFSAKMPVPGMWMVSVKKAAGFLLIGAAAHFLLPIVPQSVGRYLIPAVLVIAGIYLGFFEKSIKSSTVASSAGKAFGAAALVIAVFLAMPKTGGPALEWEPYETRSIESAAQAGQPSMLDFTADWCVYCEDLERGPFSDPKVIRAAAKFRKFRVDGTKKDEKVAAAVKRYGVRGYPTVIFFDSSGNEVKSARITGYVDSEQMLERIDSVN